MKLKYKVGDLCDALKSGEVGAIGHQANCFNTMNSGVAKAIRLAFPDAYTADCETVKGDKEKLGGLSVGWDRDDNGDMAGLIYNLYGQYNYGYDSKGYTDYDALRSALEEMHFDLLPIEIRKIGFPKIGAGLGGGDWDIIARIIEDTFFAGGFDVTIYVLSESDVP